MDTTTDSGLLPNVNSYIVDPIDKSPLSFILFIAISFFIIYKLIK